MSERVANLCCGHAACQREVERVVAERICEIAAFLYEKADIAETTGVGSFADGMRNAAIDTELWPMIRVHWLRHRAATQEASDD